MHFGYVGPQVNHAVQCCNIHVHHCVMSCCQVLSDALKFPAMLYNAVSCCTTNNAVSGCTVLLHAYIFVLFLKVL